MESVVKHLPQSLAVLSCLALTGCMDKSYDLNDIDKTFGTNAVLTLPTSSTSGIYLKNFLDLKEGDVVKYVYEPVSGDSILCVRQDGKANIKDVHIEEIRIKKPDINDIDKKIQQNTDIAAAARTAANDRRSGMRRVSVNLPGGASVEINDEEFHYTIQPGDNVSFNINEAKTGNINHDIVTLTHVNIEDATVTINMTISGFPKWLEYVYLNDLSLTVSDDPDISLCLFNGELRDFEGRTIALTDESNKRIPLSNGGADIKLELMLDGLQVGENFTFKDHEVCLNANFKVDGTFSVSTKDIDPDKLNSWIANNATEEVVNEIKTNHSLKGVMPSDINLKGAAAFDKDIVVTSVSGTMSHDVGDVEPIKLDDMPDFLNDDEVVLDLENPVLMILATSEIPASAATSMTLHSSTADKDVVTKPFTLNETEKGDTAYFYLADSPNTLLPIDYWGTALYSECTPIQYEPNSGTLAGLIRKIPEQVEVSINPVTMEEVEDLDITRDYHVSVDYDIYVPFTLGPDFKLMYRGNPELGWAQDAEDLKKIDADSIVVKANVVSNMPAKLKLSVKPIDVDGNDIPRDILDVSDVVVDADCTTPITITIKPVKPYSMNDVLAGNNGAKQLDGITYEARIVEPAGEQPTMRKDVMIQVTDIKVTINGKITYDAN